MKKTTKRIIGLLFGVAFLLSITFPALAAYSHFETGVVSETGFYVGASGTEVEVIDSSGNVSIGTLTIDSTEVTATADEINVLDGIAATLTNNELSILDGVTATASEINVLAGVTAGTSTASKAVVLDESSKIDALDITALKLNGTSVTAEADEINVLDGVAATLTYDELNILDGVTSSAAELNKLDNAGSTVTATNLDTLTDESNADSLHNHAFLTWAMTAGETIDPGLLCYFDSITSKVKIPDADSAVVIGANVGAQVEDTDPISLGLGVITAVADGEIEAGYQLKVADGGKVIRFVDADLTGDTMGSGTGGNFANQPANDAVELVSSEAADTTQQVTLYGTTNGGDGTVVTETVTLTGDTPVATTKVDWGLILGVEMDSVATGTVTVQEASGNLAITTIAPAATSAGVVEVETEIRAFNQKPTIVADDATTKSFSVIGTAVDHTAFTEKATALTGASAVTLSDEYNTVTKLLVGDVESARTVTLKVGAANSSNISVGKSLEAAAAEDDEILILLFFN